MAEFLTYRDSVTGAIGSYSPDLASVVPTLVLVDSNAKPLAFTPIPDADVQRVISATKDSLEAEALLEYEALYDAAVAEDQARDSAATPTTSQKASK